MVFVSNFNDANDKTDYERGKAQIEMTTIGINHAEDISIIDTFVSIFCTRKGIQQRTLICCNFTKDKVQECQPDLAFYLDYLEHSPPRSDAAVDLNTYPSPTLVVELSAESINDELGEKRMLYESLGTQEYWVIDVSHIRVIAFAIADGGSRRLDVSQVLPNLDIKLVETTLERSRLEEKSATIRWLWSEFGTKLKN
jgi:Uma2 family endonuclease